MSLINRYIFIKKIYKDSLIIFLKDNKYYCIKEDKYIFNYFNNNISKLELNNINYIIIDNLCIKQNNSYINNNYIRYKCIIYILNIISL